MSEIFMSRYIGGKLITRESLTPEQYRARKEELSQITTVIDFIGKDEE